MGLWGWNCTDCWSTPVCYQILICFPLLQQCTDRLERDRLILFLNKLILNKVRWAGTPNSTVLVFQLYRMDSSFRAHLSKNSGCEEVSKQCLIQLSAMWQLYWWESWRNCVDILSSDWYNHLNDSTFLVVASWIKLFVTCNNCYLENACVDSLHPLTEKREGPYGLKRRQNSCRSAYPGTSPHKQSYSPAAGTWPSFLTAHMLLC